MEGGEDLLKEMVAAGTAQTKRNPKLPATSSVPWPHNLVCKYVEQRFSKKTKYVQRATEKQEVEDMQEEKNLFEKGFSKKGPQEQQQHHH
eukprot:7369863-Lingulodinium_polyedra.AAC.1